MRLLGSSNESQTPSEEDYLPRRHVPHVRFNFQALGATAASYARTRGACSFSAGWAARAHPDAHERRSAKLISVKSPRRMRSYSAAAFDDSMAALDWVLLW